jgi:hypothetical protein
MIFRKPNKISSDFCNPVTHFHDTLIQIMRKCSCHYESADLRGGHIRLITHFRQVLLGKPSTMHTFLLGRRVPVPNDYRESEYAEKLRGLGDEGNLTKKFS